MVKKRKIRCDCGGIFLEEITKFDFFETEAMVCSKCRDVTLDIKQAEKYLKLRRLHRIMDAERKIIKIGNSMGFTLPEELKDFGAKVGKKIKIEALSAKSFKVELPG